MSPEAFRFTFIKPEAIRVRPELDLLTRGNLIRVRPLVELELALREGLLSPCEEGKRTSRVVLEGTIWHPKENLYIKFLQLPSENRQDNFRAIHKHFETFGRLGEKTWSIGLGLTPRETITLWQGEPYMGIEKHVPPEAIEFLVVPLVPLLVTQVPHLEMERNLRALAQVFQTLTKADRALPVFDHFGRRIESVS